MTEDFATQKAADAAFFEDWSEWARLDGMPARPKNFNRYRYDGDYSRYYCILRRGDRAFEIKIPPQDPIVRIVQDLPDVYQDRRAGPGFRQIAHARKQWVYWIPAQHWQAVRSVLPVLKREITAWSQTRN
jgi:hypothetical protein